MKTYKCTRSYIRHLYHLSIWSKVVGCTLCYPWVCVVRLRCNNTFCRYESNSCCFSYCYYYGDDNKNYKFFWHVCVVNIMNICYARDNRLCLWNAVDTIYVGNFVVFYLEFSLFLDKQAFVKSIMILFHISVLLIMYKTRIIYKSKFSVISFVSGRWHQYKACWVCVPRSLPKKCFFFLHWTLGRSLSLN